MNGHFTGFTQHKQKKHVQGVRAVLTSPTTVRDGDGGRGSKIQGAVFAARECGVQQHVAVNKRSSTAATASPMVQGSPGPHSLPLMANVWSSGSLWQSSNTSTTGRLSVSFGSWECYVTFTVYSYPVQNPIKPLLLSIILLRHVGDAKYLLLEKKTPQKHISDTYLNIFTLHELLNLNNTNILMSTFKLMKIRTTGLQFYFRTS